MFKLFNNIYKYVSENSFCFGFFVTLLAFMTLSPYAYGSDFKYIRVACSLFLFIKYGSGCFFNSQEWTNNAIINNLIIYAFFCSISIFFAEDYFTCGFKLLEIWVLIMFIILGAKNFNLSFGGNVFQFILWYAVLQALVAFVGYFVDPLAIVSEEENVREGRVYVPMLTCNLPFISSNALGLFGAVSVFKAYYMWRCDNAKNTFSRKLLIGVIAFIGLFVLYESSSRTSMISGVIGFLFLYKQTSSAVQRTKAIIISILLCVFFYNQISDAIMDFMYKSYTEDSVLASDDSADIVLSGRSRIWHAVLSQPEDLILGKGFGVASHETTGFTDGNAHNSMFEILLNAGVFALFFWLRFWWLIYQKYRWLKSHKEYLPFPIMNYELSIAIMITFFVKSFGNVSFVYFLPGEFFVISVSAFFVYSEKYVHDRILV